MQTELLDSLKIYIMSGVAKYPLYPKYFETFISCRYSVYGLSMYECGGYLFVCLYVLLLYVPSQQLWSWRDGRFT